MTMPQILLLIMSVIISNPPFDFLTSLFLFIFMIGKCFSRTFFDGCLNSVIYSLRKAGRL